MAAFSFRTSGTYQMRGDERYHLVFNKGPDRWVAWFKDEVIGSYKTWREARDAADRHWIEQNLEVAGGR